VINSGTLLIRADASVRIGTGHVMRCLSLVQAWQDAGGHPVFAMAASTPAIVERLRRESVRVITMEVNGLTDDAIQLATLAKSHNAAWVVVDGYQFESDYFRELKDAGLAVMHIDDLVRPMHYAADLVLNQNLHAESSSYDDRQPATRLLLGPRYALLRREFIAISDYRREIPGVAHRVLVTMGGSDPDNATLKVIRALGEMDDIHLEARVVSGGSNPHVEDLARACQRYGDRIQLLRDVSDMPSLMCWADLAVANAGTVSWELCFLGLPGIVMDLAENQRPVAQALECRRAAQFLRNFAAASTKEIGDRIRSLLSNHAERTILSRNGRELVDGRGAARTVLAMESAEIKLRPANADDCELLWRWVNDSEVRSASFSTAKIAWPEHQAWFESKLHSSQTQMFVAVSSGGAAVGQVRLDCTRADEAEVDLSVAKEHRGKGYAALLIENACQIAFAETGLSRLHALVKPQNLASINAFLRAGFLRTADTEVHGIRAQHYVRDRES